MDVETEIPLPKKEKSKNENEEPSFVLSVEGEIAIVRSGRDLEMTTKPGSNVEFAGGATGVLLAWKEGTGVVHLSDGKVNIGEPAQGTETLMMTTASTSLYGRIVNDRGTPIDGRPAPPVPADARKTFTEYKGMEERTNQYRALSTGVLGIDFSVPIGRGQTMLFQGTDRAKDLQHLWPDLLAARVGPNATAGPELCVCVCSTLEEAEKLRGQLEERGVWEHCVIVVPSSSDPGAGMMALNAAVAIAEHACEKEGEAMVLMDLEPMHRVWNILASAAGEERRAKGIIVDPKDELWTELEGTVLRESIAERRKFWFALISRAANSKDEGSVSLLVWAWEQSGGLDVRKQKALELKLEQIAQIPRISDETRERMMQKVRDEAAADGLQVDVEEGEDLVGPSLEVPGLPNWEIEELKSISDGHIILRDVFPEGKWGWCIDPYRSLPRLGTDALQPALVSVEAHKVRLKMLQGRDRANMLGDTLGARDTLDEGEGLQLNFVELLLSQDAGAPFSVEEEVARLAIVSSSQCRPLLAPGGCTAANVQRLAEKLLASEAGKRVAADIGSLEGVVSWETNEALRKEVESWEESA